MPALAELLALALHHHEAGLLEQAEQGYRQVLQAAPRHAEALHLLGILSCQQGRYPLGIDCLRQALAADPSNGDYHGDLAVAYQNLGRLDEAVACFEQALRYKPHSATACYNLGNLRQHQGRLDEAVACYRQAILVRPDYTAAHYNLGNALIAQGKLAEAVASYGKAVRLRPDNTEAHFNLGVALHRQGRLDEAVGSYRQALRLQPNNADAHNNLGNVFKDQGRLDEARAAYQQALRLRPDDAEVLNNLAGLWQEQGRLDEAVACYRQALRLRPDHSPTLNNLGAALGKQGALDEALACFHEAVRLQPDSAEAHNNLGNALREQGKVAEAVQCHRQALRLRPTFGTAQSNLVLVLNYDPEADLTAVFAEHCRWAEVHGNVPLLPPARDRDRNPERRLRIGYVSPDLRRHALTRYFEPVLAHHDPRQVEVFGYANVAALDAVTARLQALAHGWRWTCGRDAATVADWVRADGIDILVDLAGHTAGNRLDVFARKPAPVQVTWLGYPNTTGLRTVDYRLTDDVMDPPGQPVRDTEQLFRLPGGMCCFATPEDAPPVSPLPARRTGQLTFGSLHGLYKLNGHVFELWGRVLRAVPTARLLMFRDTLVGQTREFIRRQFTERGIASERLDLRQGTGAAGFLAIYHEIDVSLDVFPYTGGTTTCESLWMGVPMLSLAGVRPAARGSASLLASAGLSDWVVQTPEAYVPLAERYARDLDGLAAVRAGLRERMRGTLCDARRFTRGLEDAYRTMWRRWCAQAGGS